MGGAARGKVRAMNRWAARVAGIVILVIFAITFVQLYRTLVLLVGQQERPAATSTR